ncbi:peptidoglycan binding protein CsiV [Psychrosphaera sp.]|nr:peptidoglycan binding protein CsiV [Psychrosphaera sp.]
MSRKIIANTNRLIKLSPLLLVLTATSSFAATESSKRTLTIPNELTGLLTQSTNPYELSPPAERKENDELIEGIKSADGRWFDVEIIIFERTTNKTTRENFDQHIKSAKPRRYWDVQASHFSPNIAPLLSSLPRCHENLDPFYINEQRDKQGLPQLSGTEFFDYYVSYQTLISENWKIPDNLCLLPSESLNDYWLVSEDIDFLGHKVDAQGTINLYTNIKWEKAPREMSGYDYDDYRGVYLLDKENLALSGHAEKIDNHWGTKTLLHIGWRQPGLSPARAVSVYLRAGDNYTDEFTYDGHQLNKKPTQAKANDKPNNSTSQSSSQLMISSVKSNVDKFLNKLESGAAVDPVTNQLVMPKKQNFPMETWQLDGSIKVHLDHYLYLDANLNYRQKMTKIVDVDEVLAKESSLEASLLENNLTNDIQNVLISAANKDKAVSEFNEFNEQDPSITNDGSLLEIQYLQNFPFKQLRRTYSGDLHYLDHPKYGVLFQIRKYRH